MSMRDRFRSGVVSGVVAPLLTFVCLSVTVACPVQVPVQVGIAPQHIATPQTQTGVAALATRVPEEDDFATQVLGDPWDMSQSTDLYMINPNQPSGGFVGPAFANGAFAARLQPPGAPLWLLHQGINTAGVHNTANNLEPHSGMVNPIDAAKYRYLAFHLYRGAGPPAAALQIYWYKPGDETAGQPCGRAAAQPLYAGWHVYRVDLGLAGNWASGACPWSGQITGLQIGLATTVPNELVALDWARLVDPATTPVVNVAWNLGAGALRRSVSLFVDDDSQPGNGVMDTAATGLISGPTGSWAWQPAGLPPGTWHLHAIASRDYAGTVLGHPWDFLSPADYVAVNNLGNVSVANGVLQGTSTNGDPQLELRVDEGHPIDATLYRFLSVRINASAASDSVVYWTRQGEGVWQNLSQFVRLQPGWQTITFDLGHPLQGSWSGTVTGLRLDPATAAGVNFQVDWVGLTMDQAVGAESDLATTVVADAAVVAVNQAPLVRIVAPSMASGDDYATTVLRAPWNFDDLTSLVGSDEIASATPAGDSLSGLTAKIHSGCPGDCGDPKLRFNTGTNSGTYIDPARFKYLTVRYWQEGVQDLGAGWVMRVIWQAAGSASGISVGDDIPVRDGWPSYTEADGWRVYQADLSKLRLEPSVSTSNWGWNPSHGRVAQFRLDPTESAAGTRFHLKQVLLTADPVSRGAYDITWAVQNPDDTATISVYYSPDRDPAHKTLIGSVQQPATSLLWNTQAVAGGSYYVYLEVTDGLNTNGRFSDVPVIVYARPAVVRAKVFMPALQY